MAATVSKITSAPSVPQGPRVPRAYTRPKDGRDESGTRSMDRPNGSVSGDFPILSKAAQARLEKAGMLIAAGALVGGTLFALSKTDEPSKEIRENPSGIMTSGAESE